jgi:23S rRNA (uracil1939-C5)-methyltransferase
MRKKERILDIPIHSYTKEGEGLGSYNDMQGNPHAVAVPFSIPGDTVQARLLRKRSGVYESHHLSLIQPSQQRITARCIHFGSCGGCKWQMLPYEAQLALKQERVLNEFKPSLHPDVAIHPIIPCDPPWNYRNKMEFTFSQSLKGEKYLGLVLPGTRGKAFNLTECHLVNPWFAECVALIREWWKESQVDAYHPPSDRGALRTLTLREGMHTGDRMAILTVSGNPDYALHKPQIESWVLAMKAMQPQLPGSSKRSKERRPTFMRCTCMAPTIFGKRCVWREKKNSHSKSVRWRSSSPTQGKQRNSILLLFNLLRSPPTGFSTISTVERGR